MEAGQELDELILERFMGFLPDPTRCDRCGWKLAETVEDGCVKENCSMRPMPPRRVPPPYSTNVAAAFQVFANLPLHWRCLRQLDADTWAIEESGPDYHDLVIASAPTAPHAICLAALKAIGGL